MYGIAKNMTMNIKQVQALIDQGESGNVEFKTSTSQLKAAIQTLCAFLNGDGGTVLIGVTDSGKIVGQDVTDNTKKEIAKEIAKIEPPVQVKISYIAIGEGKKVIVLQTESANYKPYVYDARPYLRSESTTSRMPQHQYEQLLIKRNHLNYAWDETPAVGYGIEDLDENEIYSTVQQGINVNRIAAKAMGESIQDILLRLKLIKDDQLTNAAVLLFCKEVWPNYPQFHIKMARFKGITKTGEFIDNQSFYGNAFSVLSEASNFYSRHLPIASFYQETSFQRIDKPALPVLAIREALINAITHRDYSNRATSIALAIYDDRLEVWSYGKLTRELTIEDLSKSHHSHPRNQLVADLFYSRGFVEKWGTGTNKMIDYCKDDGVPLPIFEEYSGGLAVTFRFKESIGPATTMTSNRDNLTSRQKEIVDILSTEGMLSVRDIKDKLNSDVTERTLLRDITLLRGMGILTSYGSARNTLWGLGGGEIK